MDHGDKLDQFQAITGASSSSARCLLEAASWNVERALSTFFDSGPSGASDTVPGDPLLADLEALGREDLLAKCRVLTEQVQLLEKRLHDTLPSEGPNRSVKLGDEVGALVLLSRLALSPLLLLTNRTLMFKRGGDPEGCGHRTIVVPADASLAVCKQEMCTVLGLAPDSVRVLGTDWLDAPGAAYADKQPTLDKLGITEDALLILENLDTHESGSTDHRPHYALSRLTLVRDPPGLLTTMRLQRSFSRSPTLGAPAHYYYPLSALQEIEYCLGTGVTQAQARSVHAALLPYATDGVVLDDDLYRFWRSDEHAALLGVLRPFAGDNEGVSGSPDASLKQLLKTAVTGRKLRESLADAAKLLDVIHPEGLGGDSEGTSGCSGPHAASSASHTSHVRFQACSSPPAVSDSADEGRSLRDTCSVRRSIQFVVDNDASRASSVRSCVDHPLALQEALVVTAGFELKEDTDEFAVGELSGALKGVLREAMAGMAYSGFRVYVDRDRSDEHAVAGESAELSEPRSWRPLLRVCFIIDDDEDEATSILWQLVRVLSRSVMSVELLLEETVPTHPRLDDDKTRKCHEEPLASMAQGSVISSWKLNADLNIPKGALPVLTDGLLGSVNLLPHQLRLLYGLKDADVDLNFGDLGNLSEILPHQFSHIDSWKALTAMLLPDIALALKDAPEPVPVLYYDTISKLRGLRDVKVVHKDFFVSIACEGVDFSDLPGQAELLNQRCHLGKSGRKNGGGGAKAGATKHAEKLVFCCLGTGNVGTSSLVAAMVDPCVELSKKKHTHSTFKSNMFPLPSLCVGGEWVDVSVVDSRSHRAPSVAGIDLVMLCFDLSSRKSFKIAKYVSRAISDAVRFLLIGLRSDLPRQVGREEAQTLAKEIDAARYVECSALARTGVANVVVEGVMVCREQSKSCSRV